MKIKKIFVIVFFIINIFYSPNSKCETVWDIPKDDFIDIIKNENNEKKQEILDAQIELDLHLENVDLDLEECLDIALENNTDLKIAKVNQNLQKWEFNSKISEFLPDAYYQFTISKLNGAFLVGGIDLQKTSEVPITSGLHVELNALNNNKIFFETKQKKLFKKISDENVKYTKDEIILNTTLDYYDLLEKKFNIEVWQTNLKEREEEFRQNEARYRVGLSSKYDVLRAEAEYYQAKQELITALSSLRLSQVRLARTMGVDTLTPIYPKDNYIKKIKLIDDVENIETLFGYALETRPDVRMKEFEIKSLNVQRLSNFGDFIPRLSVYYEASQVGLARTGLRFSDTLSLQVQVPVGQHLGMKTFAQYKIDDLNYKKAILEFKQYKNDIKELLLEDLLNSQAYLDKIKASEKEIKAAQQSLKASLIQLDVGEATFIDVLTSQTTKTSSKQDFLNNLTQYNKAQVKLLFNSGIITIHKILEGYFNND